jgi:hypothetical protein
MTSHPSRRLVAAIVSLAVLAACESDPDDARPCVNDECALTPLDGAVTGLFGVDDLPADTQLMSRPSLIDGVLDDAAGGVAIGPLGASSQNVGLDMGTSVQAEELRVHVRTAAGGAVPSGGPVTWTVWTSADRQSWTAVQGGSQTFSSALSAYVLDFTPTEARFFKAVSFGCNTVDTFVTELDTLAARCWCAD